MAALSCIVDTDDQTGDYASLNAALVGEAQDLTDGAGDTYTINCQATTDVADTTAAAVTGWTTGEAEYITIKAVAGEEAIKTGWSATRYRLMVTDNTCLAVSEDYVRIEGLQVGPNADTTNSYGIHYNNVGASNELRVDSCRISGAGSNTCRGLTCFDGDAIGKIFNTIFENFASRGIYVNNCTVVDVLNCIIYHSSYDGIEYNAGAGSIRNSAVFKNADDFDIVGDATVDYCASDDGDNEGHDVAESGGGADWPDDFVDAANGDFTLKTDSGLVGNGTDDPGSGLYSDDIEGDARSSTWDVGADEYVAAGVTLTVAELAHAISLDTLTLTQKHTLSNVGELAHNHTLDAVVLTQAHTLIMQALLHGHSLEAPTLTQKHLLSVADLGHDQAFDNVVLTQAHILALADLTHGHSLDGIALTQAHLLALAGLSHGHTLDGILLTQKHTLIIAGLDHSHTLDAPTLTQAHVLSIADLAHSHILDNIVLTTGTLLIVSDLTHTHTIDNVALVQAHVIVVDDLGHAHDIGTVNLTQAHLLALQDLLHAHNLDAVILSINILTEIQELLSKGYISQELASKGTLSEELTSAGHLSEELTSIMGDSS